MSFERAIAFVEKQEGGWADDSHDRGGRTRYGIASATHPEVDLDTLTLEDARVIYKADYWGPAGCASMPWPLSLVVFDYAVHSGVGRAVKALQRAIATIPDGKWGPASKVALGTSLEAHSARALALEVLAARRRFLVRGFHTGAFSPREPLRYLSGFWSRTIDLAVEVGSA